MSELDDKNHYSTDQLDQMSTADLERLLKKDSQSSEDTDIDYIFSILEVIEEREKMNPSGKYTNVETAWASFQKDYRLTSKDAEPLYDFAEDTDEKTLSDSDIRVSKGIKASRHVRRPIRHKALLRTVWILVTLIIVLLSSTMVARALGYDLWGVVAKWTKDTFGFLNTVSDAPSTDGSNDYKSLQDAIDRYGITADVVPRWLPDGYAFQNIIVTETPVKTTFFAVYISHNDEISVTIISLINSQPLTYEKDDSIVTIYPKRGTDYYIMSNIERSRIVWQTENLECSISGKFSLEDAKKIIESI